MTYFSCDIKWIVKSENGVKLNVSLVCFSFFFFFFDWNMEAECQVYPAEHIYISQWIVCLKKWDCFIFVCIFFIMYLEMPNQGQEL